jgi:hypothetical protein
MLSTSEVTEYVEWVVERIAYNWTFAFDSVIDQRDFGRFIIATSQKISFKKRNLDSFFKAPANPLIKFHQTAFHD